MKPEDRDRTYLYHILERADSVAEYIQVGRERYMEEQMVQDAIQRCFEVIGEAAKRVSGSLKAGHQEVPWSTVAGFRDIIIHRYDALDRNMVWNVAEDDLPTLRAQIAAILAEKGW